VATAAVSGQMTVSWTTVTNANNYQLTFNNGVFTGTSATTSYLVPSTTLLPNVSLSVTLGSTGTSNAVQLVGPVSKPFTLPTAQPVITSAGYNGTTATVNWQAVVGASSYTVTVLGTTSNTTTVVATSTPTTALSAQVAFAATSGALYTVVVQANMGTYAGPVSATANLFSTGLFVSQTSAATVYPFVYPATLIGTVLASDTAKTGESITLYVPQISSGTGLPGLPITQGAFTLAANTGGGSAQFPYTLTISNTAATNNPWSFGFVAPATKPAAIRDGLRSDYITFLQKLETGTGSATAGGVQYVQQILGRVLPQTFAELLYYNYGLSFPDPTAGITLGSVDLRPGMVLRIAASPFQMVPGQTVTANSWLDGFVGGPVLDYDFGSTIANSGNWGTGFDAFISQLVMNGALQVATPQFNRSNNQGPGAADVTDLYYTTFSGPFYRVFTPSKLISASNTSGSYTIADNFTIAPANNFTNLCSTTNTLAPTGSNVLAYFRGRAVVKFGIRVSLNGVEKLVPIGTTVGNLLEQAGGQSPSVAGGINSISLLRNAAGVVLNATAPLSAATYYPVRLDWSNATPALYGPGWGPLAMPLLAGDRITIDC
jgi:trimeric autotransporter adhesin